MSKLSIPVIRGITVFVGGIIVGTVFTYFTMDQLIDRSKLDFGSTIDRCAALKRCPEKPGEDADSVDDTMVQPDELEDLVAWATCAKECADELYEEACATAEAMGRGDLCP